MPAGGRSVNALPSMVAWDVRLQVKYGFYTVYAVLTVAFIIGLQAMPPALRTDAAVLLIVTDPTVLGFYFIAAMVLFEKEEGVLDALVTSPLGDRGYLLSKAVTLSMLAVVASTLVAVLGHGSSRGLVVLIPGIALSASLFVLIGFTAVARYDSVNEYFISAVGWGTLLFLPLFGYVGLVESRLFYLLPAQPVLLLVEGGFRPGASWQLAYAFGYLIVGNAVAYLGARRAFRRQIVRGGDPGAQLGRRELPARGPDRQPRWTARGWPWAGMVFADLRNWSRDPMLWIAALGPLSLALVTRFGAPFVTELASPIFILEPFYPVIAGSLVLFGPAIYGFIVGMFMLEDREQGVLTAYRVSPISPRGYLLYRGVSAYVLSLATTLPALAVVGLVPIPPGILLGAVMVGALGGPTIALLFGTIASNTIEGIALSKVVNLAVLAPAIAVAVLPEPIQFVAGLLPTYWPLKAVVAGLAGDPAWPFYLVAGTGAQMLGLVGLVRLFDRRAD
jgi:fluoroquinolone transport system permease protein